MAGGNLGDRKKNLYSTADFIQNEIGIITKSSSVYETEPWGFEHNANFLNQAFEVNTELQPEEILERIKNFEDKSGKQKRTNAYLPREMDIDILFFNNEIINLPDLTIPHPRLHERKFVLEPLNEINPDLIHPVFNKKISELYKNCRDKNDVVKLIDK